MPIKFKGIPWRKNTRRKSTEETIQKRKTQEVVREQVEQIQFELEESRDFNEVSRYKKQQLNLETQESELISQIENAETNAANLENEKRNKQNDLINGGLTLAAQAAVQAVRFHVSTIGLRTGNTIRQERLQRGLNLGGQIAGIAIASVVNPLLGVSTAFTFAVNAGIREQQTSLQRERISKDNEMRLQLLGGISQRGNR